MTCRLSSVISIDYHVMVECVTDHSTNADECTHLYNVHIVGIGRDMAQLHSSKNAAECCQPRWANDDWIYRLYQCGWYGDRPRRTYLHSLHSFAAIHLLTNRFPWHIKWKKKKMKNISLNRLYGSRQHNVLLSIIIVIRRNHTIHKLINYFVYRFNTFRSRRRVRHDSVCA